MQLQEYTQFFFTVMLAAGVRESSRFNNLFTCLNLGVVVFAIIAGSIKSDTHNWNLSKSEVRGKFFNDNNLILSGKGLKPTPFK